MIEEARRPPMSSKTSLYVLAEIPALVGSA